MASTAKRTQPRRKSTNTQKKEDKGRSMVKSGDKMAATGQVEEDKEDTHLDCVFIQGNPTNYDNNKNTIRTEIQSEKRKRVSTGGTDDVTSDPYKNLTTDEKFMIIIEKLTENESVVKSLQVKIDEAVDNARVVELEQNAVEQNKRLTVLEYKSIDLESRSRRKNLIFRGFREMRDEICSEVIEMFLRRQMNITEDIVIDRAHRLGRFKRGTTRPIIVAFRDYTSTELIMSSVRILSNTDYGVSRDYPQEITQARKALWPQYKDLKSKHPGSKVRIVFPAKLIMDGEVMNDLFPNWYEFVNTPRVHTHSVNINSSKNTVQTNDSSSISVNTCLSNARGSEFNFSDSSRTERKQLSSHSPIPLSSQVTRPWDEDAPTPSLVDQKSHDVEQPPSDSE